jgi:hypothetical protein
MSMIRDRSQRVKPQSPNQGRPGSPRGPATSPGLAFGRDDPTDPVESFQALVACRRRGDHKGARPHLAALLDAGWRVTPITPRSELGGPA